MPAQEAECTVARYRATLQDGATVILDDAGQVAARLSTALSGRNETAGKGSPPAAPDSLADTIAEQMGKAFEQGFGAERDTGFHPNLHIRPKEGMEHDPGATTVTSTWVVVDQDPPFTEWGALPRRPFEHHPSAVAVEFAGLIDKARQAGAAAFRSTLTADEARERVPPGAKPFLLGEGMRLRVVDRNGTPVALLGSLAKDRRHAWAVVADMNRAHELGASAARDGDELGDFTLASERGSDEWQVRNPSQPGVVFGTMDRNPLAALLGIPASAEVTSYAGLIGLAASAGHASQTMTRTAEETFAPGP